jgi:hypothetical protein
MRLQAKSVEGGWEKRMRRVALMVSRAKESPQAHYGEKCPMVMKVLLTRP